MARVRYVEEGPPELAGVIAEIRGKRGRLSHLYRTLLNSPPVAAGWLGFLTAVRRQTSLRGANRELAILRVAVLNRAAYEYKSHLPIALEEGVTQGQIDALDNWSDADAFDAQSRAVLAYTDAMTRDVQVSDETFALVKAHFDDREIVELTAVIAAYNLVSRFLVALEVGA